MFSLSPDAGFRLACLFLFELGTLAAALAGAYALDAGKKTPLRADERLFAFLLIELFLAAALNMALSFMRSVNPGAYLAVGVAMILAAILVLRRNPGFRSLRRILTQDLSVSRQSALTGLALFLLFFPLLVISIHPAWDLDSAAFLEFMQGWATNAQNPYANWYNYISFWELSYLPFTALGHSEIFFWWPQVLAVLLFATAARLIAREVGLDRGISFLVAVHAAAIFLFWTEWGGVGSLKNDIIYNAGLLAMLYATLRIRRGANDPLTFLSAAIGMSFALVKFSGPAVIALFSALFFLHAFIVDRRRAQAGLKLWIAAGLIICAATGHYYLHNLIAYGNPVWTFALKLGGIQFPGTVDKNGTSLLDNIGRAEMWRDLFGFNSKLPPLGVMFPLAFASLPVLLLIAYIRRKIRFDDAATILALFAIVAMGVYFCSYLSASSVPGILDFIQGYHSLRYATAGIEALCILLAVLALRLAPATPWLAPSLIAGDTLLRFVNLYVWQKLFAYYYSLAQIAAHYPAKIFMLLAAIAAFAVLAALMRRPVAWVVALAAAAILFAPFCGEIYAANADIGFPGFAEIHAFTARTPAASIYFLTQIDALDRNRGVLDNYAISKIREGDVSRDMRKGSQADLLAALAGDSPRPDLIVAMTENSVAQPPPGNALAPFSARLAPYGYREALRTSHAVIWNRP